MSEINTKFIESAINDLSFYLDRKIAEMECTSGSTGLDRAEEVRLARVAIKATRACLASEAW